MDIESFPVKAFVREHTSTSELVDRDAAGIEIDSDGIAVEIAHVGLEGINLDDSPVLGIRVTI